MTLPPRSSKELEFVKERFSWESILRAHLRGFFNGMTPLFYFLLDCLRVCSRQTEFFCLSCLRLSAEAFLPHGYVGYVLPFWILLPYNLVSSPRALSIHILLHYSTFPHCQSATRGFSAGRRVAIHHLSHSDIGWPLCFDCRSQFHLCLWCRNH